MFRVITESVGSPITGLRHFHVNRRLANELWYSDSSRYEEPGYDDKLTIEGREIAEYLALVSGYEHVFIDKHGMNVTIGDAFDWDEIEPQVIAILLMVFGVEGEYEFERRDNAWDYRGMEFNGKFEKEIRTS